MKQQPRVIPAKTRLTRSDSPASAQHRTRSILRGNGTEAALEVKNGSAPTAKDGGEKNYPVKIKEGCPLKISLNLFYFLEYRNICFNMIFS